jgi:hypothetical protein
MTVLRASDVSRMHRPAGVLRHVLDASHVDADADCLRGLWTPYEDSAATVAPAQSQAATQDSPSPPRIWPVFRRSRPVLEPPPVSITSPHPPSILSFTAFLRFTRPPSILLSLSATKSKLSESLNAYL